MDALEPYDCAFSGSKYVRTHGRATAIQSNPFKTKSLNSSACSCLWKYPQVGIFSSSLSGVLISVSPCDLGNGLHIIVKNGLAKDRRLSTESSSNPSTNIVGLCKLGGLSFYILQKGQGCNYVKHSTAMK